jgi:predicted nucleotidyltransferase/uncharacterized protein (UPF0332 family)
MEFDIHKKERSQPNYSSDAFHFAKRFTKRIYDEFGAFLKAVVLFGSSVRGQRSPDSDIDLLVIVDDATMQLGPETAEAYRIIVEKIIADISKRLHVTTLKLTTFWEYIRASDPVGINILRDGISLMDTGLFDPLKALLVQGRIRPTPESIWSYFMKAPGSLRSAQWNIIRAVSDLYWAVMDSAHSALMSEGAVPPSPEHVPAMIAEKLARKGLVGKECSETAGNFYRLMKKIDHRELSAVTGAEYDRYYKDAVKFVNAMKNIVDKHRLKE